MAGRKTRSGRSWIINKQATQGDGEPELGADKLREFKNALA